jgi:hypothetical protein
MSMTLEQAIEHANDVSISAIGCECRDEHRQLAAWLRELQERRKGLGIVRCKNCIYYDPPHVENNGVRYEYTEMPADAFDVLGTGLVTTEYGINVGGRCCRDYNAGYDDDKRVYIPENNFCGRAERRTDG